MNICKCGSNKDYNECCGMYIDGNKIPETPEQLMRSRYTAYSLANIDYIMNTMHGKPLKNFDKLSTINWAQNITWQKLEVLDSRVQNNKGFVEFRAYYTDNSHNVILHELSEFKRKSGKWFYIDGVIK